MAAGALSALCEFICLSSRSNAITDNRFRMTKKCTRVLYHTLVLFLNLTVLLFMFFTTTEESQKLEALKIDPCPTKEFFRSPVVFFISDSAIRNFFMFFWVPALLFQTFANSVFHWACTIYYLFVAPPSRSTSAETRRAQRHFLIGTMIQTSIPVLTLMIPPLVLIFLFSKGYYNQGLMNLGMIFYGLNGLVESLAILSVYRPYRNAVKDILNFRKSKEPKVQTIPVREVCGNSGFGRTHLRI
ncbi:Protein CBG24529 [Caenorhabditis briggsae]|uniref:Protein CBG24529 n=1 Tax=Caenorhabditis briggsae TaxID=6238 RepID=A8WKX1_CAEBR|nr:Protein CBG24529 [Caenorhabditis briggsae]CAP21116.1 Protein CBG24529 [Caenorhabditis briggsae]